MCVAALHRLVCAQVSGLHKTQFGDTEVDPHTFYGARASSTKYLNVPKLIKLDQNWNNMLVDGYMWLII